MNLLSVGSSDQVTQHLENKGFNVKNMTGRMLYWKGKIEQKIILL